MTASRFLLVFLLLASKFSFGQSSVYHPLPDSNAHWTETSFWLYWGTPPTPVYAWYTVFTEGDTVINSQGYTKIYETGSWGAFGPQLFYSYEYKGAYRQDTALRKVYIVPPSGSLEVLLYDFDLSIGDTLPSTFGGVSYNEVLDIDSVLVGTAWHKRFLLNQLGWGSTGIIDTNYALIEGVGSTLGFIQPVVMPFENGSHLECFAHFNITYPPDSGCLFYSSIAEAQEPFIFTVYPNPASDFVMIPTGQFSKFEIINTIGEVVMTGNNGFETNSSFRIDVTGLQNGLYILRTENRIGRFLKL